jgi:hypothetical protein
MTQGDAIWITGSAEGGSGVGGHTKTLWRASRSSRIQSSPPSTEPRGISLSARLRCDGRMTELGEEGERVRGASRGEGKRPVAFLWPRVSDRWSPIGVLPRGILCGFLFIRGESVEGVHGGGNFGSQT